VSGKVNASARGNDLFDHRPERLAINGYRLAMAGYELGDPSCWDEFWNDLVAEGGLSCACDVSGALQYYVRSLRSHCQRRLQFFPRACLRACADECLVLSLLAACQNKDRATLDYCLGILLPPENAGMRNAVAEPARLVAARMKRHALNLMPVPLDVIASIVRRSCLTCPVAESCRH
jgi:hypothetical protein